MKSMRVITHAQDSSIPSGKAAICMDDNGWVGTDNGMQYTGAPAFYPEAQAYAIAAAWGFVMERGVKVFPCATPTAEVNEFRGLPLFDLFPTDPNVLDWLDGKKQVGPIA